MRLENPLMLRATAAGSGSSPEAALTIPAGGAAAVGSVPASLSPAVPEPMVLLVYTRRGSSLDSVWPPMG